MRSAALMLAMLVWPLPASAQVALDELVKAYPDHLVSHDSQILLWKDGTRADADSAPPRGSQRQVRVRAPAWGSTATGPWTWS